MEAIKVSGVIRTAPCVIIDMVEKNLSMCFSMLLIHAAWWSLILLLAQFLSTDQNLSLSELPQYHIQVAVAEAKVRSFFFATMKNKLHGQDEVEPYRCPSHMFPTVNEKSPHFVGGTWKMRDTWSIVPDTLFFCPRLMQHANKIWITIESSNDIEAKGWKADHNGLHVMRPSCWSSTSRGMDWLRGK